MKIERFTTRYHPLQDRFCLDCASLDNEGISLWLTHRLLKHLLPALLQLITPVAETRDKAVVLAQWAFTTARDQQPQARSDLGPSTAALPPVAVAPRPATWLVSSIDLQTAPHQVTLRFNSTTVGTVATLSLSPERLRQWLGILYRLWTGAGWTESLWPHWLEAAVIEPSPTSEGLIH